MARPLHLPSQLTTVIRQKYSLKSTQMYRKEQINSVHRARVDVFDCATLLFLSTFSLSNKFLAANFATSCQVSQAHKTLRRAANMYFFLSPSFRGALERFDIAICPKQLLYSCTEHMQTHTHTHTHMAHVHTNHHRVHPNCCWY